MNDSGHLESGCSCQNPTDEIKKPGSVTKTRYGTKILIVDDIDNMRLLLSEYLEGLGYEEILTAASAEEAFEHLTTDPGTRASDAVDLILMDISMPGIDGIEACQRIKNDMGCKDVPIIMVTSHVEPDYLRRAFDAGAMDYVTTPFNRLELQVRVKSALNLKQSMDAQKRVTALVKDLLEERDIALQAANENVKVLHGLLPICASCKKIRNDSGSWSELEAYISENSEAEFSHGICPDCHQKLYPKIYGRLQEKGLLPT